MTKDKTSLIFTGDIGFDRYMDRRWEDSLFLSDEIMNFFNGGDHIIANIEGAVIEAIDDGSRGTFFHSMNPEAAVLFKKINADIWSIGNNHTMDAGIEGMLSTRRIANEMGYRTIGAGLNEIEASEPVYLDEAGGIGIFNVAYLKECVPATKSDPGIFRWDDMNLIYRRIKEIKSKCRWCIVVVHGGEEFASLPNPYTRDRYLEYLNMGADIVVGHHPHVVENYELFDNKAIFYSLGNFIFDTDYQRVHLYTDTGVLLKLNIGEDSFEFEALGTKIDRNSECITAGLLPDIFTDINEDEYRLLAPLNAKAFLSEEKRKMNYLLPDRFKNDKEWEEYIFSEEPDGYDSGKHMDLSIVYELSEKEKDGEWKKSSSDKVVKYILKQI